MLPIVPNRNPRHWVFLGGTWRLEKEPAPAWVLPVAEQAENCSWPPVPRKERVTELWGAPQHNFIRSRRRHLFWTLEDPPRNTPARVHAVAVFKH